MSRDLALVCASANPDKVREMAEILAGVGVVVLPRPEGLPDVVEDGDTLEANARLKAAAVAGASGRAAVADDTGLEVAALGGAPGVRTGRYAGEHASYADNVAKLLDALVAAGASTPEERRARFRTVVLVRRPDGAEALAEGVVNGWIALAPRGEAGFGYDPVFVPDEWDGRTFAEMSSTEKHAISHRGRALRALAEALEEGVL
ncbi:MAG: XTP/dITP diphosphohydrolase [Acidimicrobiia bacterium]|nr:XTP/dITP diphosphohydrolase [Acidimicrobiia bacterium]